MKQSNQTGDRAPCEGSSVGRIGLGLAALGRPTYLTAGRSDALGAPVAVRN